MAETPRYKRPFLDVEISPEGKASVDTSCLRDILSDTLDEKFEEHLKPMLDAKFEEHFKPIKEEFAQFKRSAETEKKQTAKTLDHLKRECDLAKAENNLLRQQLSKLESFQRKNNLKIVGLSENKGENIEIAVISIFNEFLQTAYKFDGKTLKHIHRLGPFQKGRKRDVLARFANFKDKLTALEMKEKIRAKYGILLFDDLPLDIERAHKKLHPVLQALRHVKETSGSESEVRSVRLKNGSLILNGRSYTQNNLHELPLSLQTDKLFTLTNEDKTAFFRGYSPLSNHYECKFEVRGETYTSMEKYLMVQKAKLFKDVQILEQMKTEDDPVKLKHMGKTVKNFNSAAWIKEIDIILYDGLYSKFSQNKDLGNFLKNTGKTVLAEANPHDRVFSVGLSLFSKDIWNTENWCGKNKLGNTLMKVRDMLK